MKLELTLGNKTPDESVLVELYGDDKKYLCEFFGDGNIALVEKTERGTRAWDFTLERLVKILSETNG